MEIIIGNQFNGILCSEKSCSKDENLNGWDDILEISYEISCSKDKNNVVWKLETMSCYEISCSKDENLERGLKKRKPVAKYLKVKIKS